MAAAVSSSSDVAAATTRMGLDDEGLLRPLFRGLSNGDVFDKDHDELDFEFLGNRRRHEWRLQTNVYGNGSTERGRAT
nr:unnamed protein product [Digitaria exilis]